MDKLIKLDNNKNGNYYKVKNSKFEDSFKRYVFTSTYSRAICNQPELVGFKYTDYLEKALVLSLKAFPDKKKFLNIKDEKTFNILSFLRGGLNFGLRRAISTSFGIKNHCSSFLSSQRYKRQNEWKIKDDQYQKFTFYDEANIFCGDVIATGSTIENGFERIGQYFLENKIQIRNIVFYTIGCAKTDEILYKFHKKFKKNFPKFENTYIIYLDGIFGLANDNSKLSIKLTGTDLLRSPALLTPELELSQFDKLEYALERCTIYDAGSRSFDITTYKEDVVEYWDQVKEIALKNNSVFDYWHERFPCTEYKDLETLIKSKEKAWEKVPKSVYSTLLKAHDKLWEKISKKPITLSSVCSKRITKLNTL
ncbi:MAG: hypothetical protein ABIA04_01640 [Pseudomonadota bacterium]